MMVMAMVTPGNPPPITPIRVPMASGSRYLNCTMLAMPENSSSYMAAP